MTRPTTSTPRSGSSTVPVALAADLLSECGAACCPSLSAFIERLIDRQATAEARR